MTAAQQRAQVQAGVLTTGHVSLICQVCKNLLLECPCDGPRRYVLLDCCAKCQENIIETKAVVICCQWCLNSFKEQPCDASDGLMMFVLCADHLQRVYNAYNARHVVYDEIRG